MSGTEDKPEYVSIPRALQLTSNFLGDQWKGLADDDIELKPLR